MSEPTSTRLPDDDALVIGEGVLLDLEPARFASRLLSALIDYSILGVVLLLSTVLFGALLAALDSAAAAALFLVVMIGIVVGLPTAVETLTRGKSPGRYAVGLRVVRDDGGPIRLRHAAIRALLAVFEIWLLSGALALICSLINARGKRVGDLVAGTYVVRERGYQPPVVRFMMPVRLGGWAQGADIARLPDDLAMAVRQFMLRRALLAPGARAALGLELAEAVRERVAPAPPPGTLPEDFLEAVLVARRDRELARLVRERDQASRRREMLGRHSVR